jgi:predicted nucleotidyltransferase
VNYFVDLQSRRLLGKNSRCALRKQASPGIYQAVRFVLPTERFAIVKQEQIAWLKKADAASSLKEKCELIEARIKVLRDLLW